MLGDAALLHDVGYHISYDRHHKHSYHLILHAELLGVAPEEQVVVANVARYHRGAEPKKKHRNYGELSSELRETRRIVDAIDTRDLRRGFTLTLLLLVAIVWVISLAPLVFLALVLASWALRPEGRVLATVPQGVSR